MIRLNIIQQLIFKIPNLLAILSLISLLSIILITGSPFKNYIMFFENNHHVLLKNISIYAQDNGGSSGDSYIFPPFEEDSGTVEGEGREDDVSGSSIDDDSNRGGDGVSSSNGGDSSSSRSNGGSSMEDKGNTEERGNEEGRKKEEGRRQEEGRNEIVTGYDLGKGRVVTLPFLFVPRLGRRRGREVKCASHDLETQRDGRRRGRARGPLSPRRGRHRARPALQPARGPSRRGRVPAPGRRA